MVKVEAVEASELAGGNWLKEKGKFHFVVDEVRKGMSSGDKPKPIEGFTLMMTCLAGTAEGCAEHKCSVVIWEPKPSDSEKAQKMSHKQLTALGVAGDLVRPADVGKPLEYDEGLLKGRQLLMELAYNQTEDDNGNYVDDPEKGLRIHYANIWHVDDPAGKSIPKNPAALDLIGKESRHDAAYFAPIRGGVQGGVSPTGKAAVTGSGAAVDDLVDSL